MYRLSIAEVFESLIVLFEYELSPLDLAHRSDVSIRSRIVVSPYHCTSIKSLLICLIEKHKLDKKSESPSENWRRRHKPFQ